MLFNSLEFGVFFVVVFTAYWLLSHRKQNWLLLFASYYFYGSWNWKFLSLIALSTVIDFAVGLRLSTTDDAVRRKRLLLCSVVANLGILGTFKYFNFFADSLARVLSGVGLEASWTALHIVLPVGISFYTFQTMSYTIDVYKRKMEPTRSFLDFAVFVAFFPQLVAGPIERASRLLPQVSAPRTFSWDQLAEGWHLILWGLYKKVFIADGLARVANQAFVSGAEACGLDVILGLLAFCFQIYGDFSGYSDIARGVAKCLGFELMVNFDLPYVSKTPSEFWQRWHISLSSWLRDYLYFSLGGNRRGNARTYWNLSATMLLGGLWHGAAWTYVVWGAYQGAILMLYRPFERSGTGSGRSPKSGDSTALPASCSLPHALLSFTQWALMFVLTNLGWLIFRATSVRQIGRLLAGCSLSPSPQSAGWARTLCARLALLLPIQFGQYRSGDHLFMRRWAFPLRLAFYFTVFYSTVIFGVFGAHEFIYFQF